MRTVMVRTMLLVAALGCGGDGGGGTGNADPVLTTVTVAPQTVTLAINETRALTVSAMDQNGAPMSGVAAPTFTSSDQTRATVSAAGVVTGKAAGPATITASITHGGVTRSGTSAITVSAPPAVFTSLEVLPATASIEVGATRTITATPKDQNGTTMTGLPAATFSSSDQSKATVSSAGVVTGVAAGTATITASLTSGTTTRTGTSVITVTAAPPTGATVQAGLTTAFNPTTVTIARTATVTWQWAGLSHNVTFDAVTGAPADIPTRSTGQESRQFNTAGTFPYQCTLHAGMTGQVIVTP